MPRIAILLSLFPSCAVCYRLPAFKENNLSGFGVSAHKDSAHNHALQTAVQGTATQLPEAAVTSPSQQPQQQAAPTAMIASGLSVDSTLPTPDSIYLSSSPSSNETSSAKLMWLNMSDKIGEGLQGYEVALAKSPGPSPAPTDLSWEVIGYVKSNEVTVENLDCGSLYLGRVAIVVDATRGEYGKETITFSTPSCDAFWKDATDPPDKMDVVIDIGDPLPIDASLEKKVFRCPNPGKRVSEDNGTYTVNCTVPEYKKIKGPSYTAELPDMLPKEEHKKMRKKRAEHLDEQKV